MTPEHRHDWKIQRLEQRVTKPDVGVEVLLELAEAYFQKGYYYGAGDSWYEQATQVATRSVTEHGGCARAHNILANALYGLGDFDAAERHYRDAIEKDPSDSLAYVGLGNLHKQRSDNGRAIEAFSRATELNPDLWQAHYNLGGALYTEARERDFRGADDLMDRAVYHLVTALRLRPFESFLGNIYKDLGELFLHTRQYKYARRFFTRLIQHEEYGSIAHYYLGLTHFSMGRYNNAIHHYREFLKSEPKSALAYSKIGLSHLELGEWDRAREACEHALKLESSNILARFSLGCIDLDQQLFSEAEQRFAAILEDNSDYFPAYVELVKTHYLRNNFAWLFDTLNQEIENFEDEATFDGGRQYYKGNRGRTRRKIDVLLAQIQEMGTSAFGSLVELMEQVTTDSLRFQMWEQLYDLSRRNRVEQVLDQLEDPGQHFGRKLGRTALLLSQYLPEEAIIDAFHVGEDVLKRRAQKRKGKGADLPQYQAALKDVHQELKEYQAYLLLSLAVKGTPSAEDFLTDSLESDDRELSSSSAISLLFYGSDRAIRALRDQANSLPEPHASRLRELVELGIARSEEAEKIIDLEDAARKRDSTPSQDRPHLGAASSAPSLAPRQLRPGPGNESCSLCSRNKGEVDRLMSGNRVYLCNLCVSYVHQHRAEMQVPDKEDHVCSFCTSSIFEVRCMHQAKDLLLCNRCLDTCVTLLAKEEVERFLRSFS
jgi:tetratricopeptide (TPR) repeat protein